MAAPEAPPVECTVAFGGAAGLGLAAGLAGAGTAASGAPGPAGVASVAGVCASPADGRAVRGAINNKRVNQVRVIRVGLRGAAR